MGLNGYTCKKSMIRSFFGDFRVSEADIELNCGENKAKVTLENESEAKRAAQRLN
jgi:hypothetical protein